MKKQTQDILDTALYMSQLQSDAFKAGIEYQKQQQKRKNNE